MRPKTGQEKRMDGHVDGEDKLEAFMRADACVIPSFTENFGMVVAEALAHGVPVVTSRGTPWSDVEKHGCGLWIDNKPRAIADAIRSLRAMDLRAMGNKGRDWINAAKTVPRILQDKLWNLSYLRNQNNGDPLHQWSVL